MEQEKLITSENPQPLKTIKGLHLIRNETDQEETRITNSSGHRVVRKSRWT